MVYGVILAGGSGRRMRRSDRPKQFLRLRGVPILILTMRSFLDNKKIERLYVAVHPEWLRHAQTLSEEFFSPGERNRVRLIPGGASRLDSFLSVIREIESKDGLGEEDLLICHDAVRPFVRQRMIDDCVDAAARYGFSLTAIPMADTPHVSDEEGFLDRTIPRDGLYSGQTPSGFRARALMRILEGLSEEEKRSATGTTQLVLKAGCPIRLVKGSASNFKITTDADLELAERMLGAQERRSTAVLDCTLRDGGIVVDFNFGTERMCAIRRTLERTGVEYIECGYLDALNGSPVGRSCFDSETSIERTILADGKKPGTVYLAMIDYGAFDPELLGDRRPGGIDGIRLAFHREDWREAVAWGRSILDRGYELFIQPMVTTRYGTDEYLRLIDACNARLPDATAFYLADSFGQMDYAALTQKLSLADARVSAAMKLGFHAHDNRQMAYANALAFIRFPVRHDRIVDASVFGMGKGAGNLCTELIASALRQEGKSYDVTVLYESIHDYFEKQRLRTPWGYSLNYYLSSVYGCSPSYVKIFLSDNRITTPLLVELLEGMPEEKRARCDRTFAKEYLTAFWERH